MMSFFFVEYVFDMILILDSKQQVRVINAVVYKGIAAAVVFNECGWGQQGSCQITLSNGAISFVEYVPL